jgi:hypothetical protein
MRPQDPHYYVQESCGIALGVLITALHHAGLATLTHTRARWASSFACSPDRFVLLPVGCPTRDCEVPALVRKPLADILVEFPPRP